MPEMLRGSFFFFEILGHTKGRTDATPLRGKEPAKHAGPTQVRNESEC